eukprot:TRINITY_DN8504_c0_g2_i1.p1 TRINITY_DN8504_c0_g2~~TRINITY_DN8504_c0_g2_i1.p1  ORF type:complete len:572 (+),score=90.86 TRINITY_DN8504_c0_g2_i1:62-1717(+)
MIDYEPGYWQFSFIFSCHGSVFPKAVFWAVPSALSAALIHTFVDMVPDKNVSTIWSSFCFVLGFLIVFRSQQAYSRFWEGTTLLNQVRGEWFNAVSSLFAFCSDKDEKRQEVKKFQALIVRLMSLLYCSALQQVAKMEDEDFEILDFTGVSPDSMDFWMSRSGERCEILLQWIQKLICANVGNGVITIAPPILSRVFQELSRGIVGVNNATKLSDILFPFPYAQMVTVMLLITTCLTPVVAGTLMESVFWAAGLTFVTVFAFWSINYIAAEIELPFGDDPNDLPIAEYQRTMNRFLQILMENHTQMPPSFVPTGSLDQPINVVKMSDESMTRIIENSRRSRKSAFAGEEEQAVAEEILPATAPLGRVTTTSISTKRPSVNPLVSTAAPPSLSSPTSEKYMMPPEVKPAPASGTENKQPMNQQQSKPIIEGPGPPTAAQTYNVFVSVGNISAVAGNNNGSRQGHSNSTVGETDARDWSNMQSLGMPQSTPQQKVNSQANSQDKSNFLIPQPLSSEPPSPPLGLSEFNKSEDRRKLEDRDKDKMEAASKMDGA